MCKMMTISSNIMVCEFVHFDQVAIALLFYFSKILNYERIDSMLNKKILETIFVTF